MTLLDDVEAFLSAHDVSATAFGDRALQDRHFVRQLRAGRRVWPETEAKVRRFMATYRPEEVDSSHERPGSGGNTPPSPGKAHGVSPSEIGEAA